MSWRQRIETNASIPWQPFALAWLDLNEALNAVVASDCDGALKAAEASRIRWTRGDPLGSLDGIPSTVKDSLFV